VRLQLISRFVVKFIGEFRPAVRDSITPPRYQTLMEVVSRLMWQNGKYPALWRAQSEFLHTSDGIVYVNALIAELDVFRATLREWEATAQARLEANGTPSI